MLAGPVKKNSIDEALNRIAKVRHLFGIIKWFVPLPNSQQIGGKSLNH